MFRNNLLSELSVCYTVSILIINIMLSVYRVIFIDLVAIPCYKLLRVISRA